LEAVVDGVAAAAALTGYLPVFEPGDQMFDVCSGPAVDPPVLVAMMGRWCRTAVW
jgi:hypothetical protein